MSGSAGWMPPPYIPGTPEYEQYMRGLTRGVTVPTTHVASGLVSLGTLPGEDVNPSTGESWLPGIVTRVGGGILSTADAATKIIDALTARPEAYVRHLLGLQDRGFDVRPTPQWIERLGDLGESSRTHAEQIVHPVAPQSPEEEVLADVGDLIGTMATPLPGGAVKALPTIVQKAVSPLLHITMPLSTEHKLAPFVLGTGVLGAQEAAAAYGEDPNNAQQAQPTATPQQSIQIKLQPASQTQPVTTQPVQAQPAPTQAQPAAAQFSLPPPSAPPAQAQKPTTQFSLPPPTTDTGGFSLPAPGTDTTQQQQVKPQTGESGITYPEMVGGGLALLAPFLGIRYGKRGLTRLRMAGPADVTSPEYRQQTQENRMYRLQPNPDFTGTNVPAAPLAVAPGEAVARRVQAATQDDTALLRAHVANSDASNAELAHEIGDVKNQSAQQSRVDSFMETGKHEASQTQTVAPQQMLLRYGRLSEPQKGVVDSALWAATEIDHRTNMFNTAMRNGNTYDPLKARRYFRNNDDADLRDKIDQAMRDPETKQVVENVWQIGRANIDMMRRLGYPISDLDRIQRTQPHYVPTVRDDGTPVHVFEARDTDPYSGPITPPTRAIDAFMMHQDSLLKRMENDVLNRKIVNADMVAQQNDPRRAAMFSLKTGPGGGFVSAKGEQSIVIPRPHGWETHLVNNPEIHRAMQASPAVKRSILQASRNWLTQMTTGPGALSVGKFFPAVHGLIRGPYLQNLNTPTNMYASALDMAYKRIGGRGSIRLSPDPWLGAPAMAFKTQWDRANHAVSNMLMRGSRNPANMLLRHAVGDNSVDRLQQRLADRYRNSLTYRWRAAGGANSALYGRMFVPAYQQGTRGTLVHNPAAVLAPRAVTPASFLGKRMPFSTNLNNLIREVFSSFMEAPNLYSFALNERNPNLTRAQLVSETRGLLGDPGVHGGGRFTQWAIRNLPYVNATIQDLSRAARAKSEMPISRGIHRSILLGTGAAASIYTAMHTPGGLAHLLNLVSTNQMASGPILYNGNDTDNTTQISLPQSERAVYPIILDAMLHLLNAWDAHKDDATFERMYHTLADMHSAHVSNAALTAAGHGLSQSVDPFTSVAPGVSAVATALTGKQIRVEPYNVIADLVRGRMPRLSSDVATQARVPGETGRDSILGSQEGARWEHTLSALFGLGSDLLETVNRGYGAWKHGEGVSGAIERMLDNLGQHYKDQNQTFNNVLWPNATRISQGTPLVESTNKALDVMRDTVGTKSDIVNQGFTRKGSGVPVSGMAEREVSNDPVVRNMRLVTQHTYDLIDHKFMPHVRDIRKLDADLENVPMSEDARRQKHNEYMREINKAYIPIAQNIARLNEQLSRMAGTRIDISSGQIDWRRGSEQFH